MEDYKLINNKRDKQYEFHIERYIPKIEYMREGDEIYLTHTEVPVALEGRGVGTQLVEKTLLDIEEEGLRLIPLCGFVIKYIRKHPEWNRIVNG